jgi:transcriptional regulator with XRE-family HTH domain
MYQDLNMNLIKSGEKIRAFRKRKGYSQAELAEKTDLSAMTISRIEKGSTAMNILQLKRLSEVLEATADEILDCE